MVVQRDARLCFAKMQCVLREGVWCDAPVYGPLVALLQLLAFEGVAL